MLDQNIRALRKQKGYTQETFAQELNVVRQTVSKWEKGYSVPDALMLEKIAELFEVSVGELLGEDEIKAGERTELEQISAQLSLLNNQLARELVRKRRNRRITLIVLAGIAALALIAVLISLIPLARVGSQKNQAYYWDSESGQSIANNLTVELDRAVSDVILQNHPVDALRGECPTESHFVYATDETGDAVTVYLVEDYALFGFHNGFFTDVSGAETPAVLVFQKTESGYRLLSRKTAQVADEVKTLFPRRIAKEILRGLSAVEKEQLWLNQLGQATDYLGSIGRNAVICRSEEIGFDFLSEHGIAAEVSNKICEMGLAYDTTIGNHELLENGVRYVYQTEVDLQNDWITFTKFTYDNREIVEFIAVDAKTGELVPDAPQPETVIYHRGQIPRESYHYTTAAYFQ